MVANQTPPFVGRCCWAVSKGHNIYIRWRTIAHLFNIFDKAAIEPLEAIYNADRSQCGTKIERSLRHCTLYTVMIAICSSLDRSQDGSSVAYFATPVSSRLAFVMYPSSSPRG